MKRGLKILLGLLLAAEATGQQVLYVSKQTGEYSSFNGSYAKQTDRFEHGSISLSVSGPIIYAVDPGSVSIGTNESKSWIGVVKPDVSNAPAAGTRAEATLTGTYDIKFSRPYGGGISGNVLSTYYCSDSAGVGGCVFHGGNPGAHEIVQSTGSYPVPFTVVSILVNIPDTICLDGNPQKSVTAVSFPENEGDFSWSSADPNVVITDAESKTATISLTDTSAGGLVTVRFTIGGVSYEKQAFVSSCQCSCKPIEGGISAGPLMITGALEPAGEPDAEGNCRYSSDNAGVSLSLIGTIQRGVTLDHGVTVGLKKNCQTGAVTEVSVDWKGELTIPAISIRNVKTFDLTVQEIHVQVGTEGNLAGSVQISVVNPVDRDLSWNKKFIMLRNGTTSTVIFTYSNTNSFNGTFDFSGIQGIQIDIQKPGVGEQPVVLASYTGNMNSEGLLKGDFSVVANPTYKTNLFTATLLELVLGSELDIPTGGFKLTSGSGKIRVSEMKGLTGTIDLGLVLPEEGNYTARATVANMTAFSMILEEVNLEADFSREFDITEIRGSLKAKHNQFDARLDVDNFKVTEGSLAEFSCSGSVGYRAFSFVLENATYNREQMKLSIDAKVELAVTGTAAMISVTGFTISQGGAITVGSITADLDRPPVAIHFSATFGDNRFLGSFTGLLMGVGLSGDIEVGAEEEPDYHFAHLKLIAQTNIPLGNTGLKLTQLGGRIGYNYSLNLPDGPGGPQQGTYLIGLLLGVADVAGMCEVTGEPSIQFGSAAFDLGLSGTVKILKNNQFFSGHANVVYKIPARTLSGNVGAELSIPGSGWMLQSQNLNIKFFFGNNQFQAHGSNMSARMFGGKLALTNGIFQLDGSLEHPTSLTGSLGGTASAGFGYALNANLYFASVTGNVQFNMNSNVSMAFDQNGLQGDFDVHAVGSGDMTVTTWFGTSPTVSGSAAVDGSISYAAGTLTLLGNVTITLPFNIPYQGNTFSTGTIGISI